MKNMANVLLLTGGVIVVLGIILKLLGATGFKGLPGDIAFQRGNFSFFFPIVSCIVFSIILSIVFSLFRR